MFDFFLNKLEDAERPLLGPNIKILKFWGLLLPKNSIKKYFHFLRHALLILFVTTECIDVWFVKSDINLLLNNMKITMLSIVGTFKGVTFMYWQDTWTDIIEYVTQTDIDRRASNDKRNQLIIKKYTSYSRKITYICVFLTHFTGFIVMVTPFLKYVLFSDYRENVRNRIEPYTEVISSWVPFDKNTLIGHLGASLIQWFGSVNGAGWISSFDAVANVTMVFFKGELDLLQRDCAKIFGTKDEPVSDSIAIQRLKDCHRRHVSLTRHVHLFNNCLSPIMFLYALVCSFMLCGTAYQITVETSLMQQVLTTEYLVFGTSQLFIYCWHSNNVLYASLSLSSGPYDSIWWPRNVTLQKKLFILITQFQEKIIFTVGPFSTLSVPTFISILKGAYSFYTLLNETQM